MEYTDRYKAFCKRMSIYRKLMDYDQVKMAVRVGMTTPEYSNREAGRSMVSGIDLRKISDSGADIDKMLVDVDEKPCRYVISSEIETFGEESKKEYVRGVVSEHILYMCVKRPFAPAGQSTQMIIGATPETDLTLIRTTQHLYKNYDLKRVFYSAYIPLNEDSALPQLDADVPLLREHRLYQADWLLRFYGFQADELLSESRPNFNEQLDPKCDWAIRHLGQFPVEVQNASYDMLLRIPGIGPKSARRIVETRRYAKLDFDILKKIGVVLKRAHYFITCNGRMMYRIPIEESYITSCLTDDNHKENWEITHQNEKYHQLSLFE